MHVGRMLVYICPITIYYKRQNIFIGPTELLSPGKYDFALSVQGGNGTPLDDLAGSTAAVAT